MASPLALAAIAESELVKLRDDFALRRDAMIAAEKGKPLVVAKKREPLRGNRSFYTRHYSYSIVNFAMKAFWLGEANAEANAALVENCRFYIENKPVRIEHDSFYWSTDVLCRLVEFFGRDGSRAPGRLTPATEAIIREMMWLYCDDVSRLTDADHRMNKTWHIIISDNHQLQQVMSLWHFLKFLHQDAAYRDRSFSTGGTPAVHYRAWNAYVRELLCERIRKGLFVEYASKSYNYASLKCIYNFHDFAIDPELARLAAAFLDVYWATRAEEEIDGVRGGAAARVYQGPASRSAGHDKAGRLEGFYFGRGHDVPPADNDYAALTSSYRIPLLVMELALDHAGRGSYEVRQRVVGGAEPGFHTSPDYRMRMDGEGSIVRYSYCTPAFVIATSLLEAKPAEYWAAISSQNRWQGVIFAGHPDARIVPECEATGASPNTSDRERTPNRTFNQNWSVQSKGTLITQKLRDSRSCGAMRVWFSAEGLTQPVERNGWVFVEARDAFAAVRVARGGFTWDAVPGNEARETPGKWLRCVDEWSPVILEVVPKSDVDGIGGFESALRRTEMKLEADVLHYRGRNGTNFTFFADQSRLPQIGGRTIEVSPRMVFDSPFVQSEWNSGVVTIQKSGKKIVIDVNERRSR